MGPVGRIWWTHRVPASKGGSALGVREVTANSVKGGLWGIWLERRLQVSRHSLATTSQEENGKLCLQLKWELWDQLRVANEWLVLEDRCKSMAGTSKQSVGTATAQKGLRFKRERPQKGVSRVGWSGIFGLEQMAQQESILNYDSVCFFLLLG